MLANKTKGFIQKRWDGAKNMAGKGAKMAGSQAKKGISGAWNKARGISTVKGA